MIPLVRSILHALLWDAMAVRRWLRGLAVAFSLGGVAFADGVAEVIGHPGWARAVKITALGLAFIGGAISIGERNAAPAGSLVPLEAPPPRGMVELLQVLLLVAIGAGVVLFALAHRGAP